MLTRLLFAALLCGITLCAQVLLIDGDGAFVVPARASVELKVVLSAASLGGGVAGINVRFIAPAGMGDFAGRTSVTVVTDAAGRASAQFTTGMQSALFSVDAVAELGDGAVASFAFTVGASGVVGNAGQVKAEVRRTLLRNAADGSNLQLVGPFWLPYGSLVRPARWGKEKEAGGLWRAEEGSWFFWVDDGPAKAWAKPTRFYLVPGTDVARTRIGGERWWPMAKVAGGEWQSLGRATSFGGALIGVEGMQPGTGDACAVMLVNTGQAGGRLSFDAFTATVRKLGVTRLYADLSLAVGCKKTYLLVSGAGDREGVWLDRWMSWEELGSRLQALGELVAVIETNQSAQVAKWWQGLGVAGQLISSTDELRIGYMQPLRGGFVARGLAPAVDRLNGDWEAAVRELARGELVVASPRPQFNRLVMSGPRRIALADVEFSNAGGLTWVPFDRSFGAGAVIAANVSDPKIGVAFVSGKGLIVRGLAEGRADLSLTVEDQGVRYVGNASLRVGLGNATVRACLVVVGQGQCLGQMQRNIPVAEDEVGGHVFIEIQDENIAAIDSKIYAYNRGERNVPLAVRGLKAGRTFVRFRSHDGEVVGDVPIQVAEILPPTAGVPPVACPEAATYRANFAFSGGDETLYEPFGGAWWGNGITLVFRRIGSDRFEIRSSGAPEGQFFAMSGTLGADCSFIGSGQGVAGLRVTTAQVKGKISARAGVFDSMTLDYSIGVDGVYPRPIEYRGTGLLAAGCNFTLSQAENLSWVGGIYPVRVSSPSLCPWTAELSSGAAEIVVGLVGFGPGVVWLQVPENRGAARQIEMRVGGQRLVLTQPVVGDGGPELQAVLNAASFAAVVARSSLALVFGSGLTRDLRVGGGRAAVVYSNSALSLVQIPADAPLGVVNVTSGSGRPYPVMVERSAPGVFESTSTEVYVTGIDLSLPVLVEVDGVEREVLGAEQVGLGLYRIRFATGIPEARGKAVVVRQGGRSSQRGALVM